MHIYIICTYISKYQIVLWLCWWHMGIRWITQNGISRYDKPRCCLGSHHMWSWAESPITPKRSRLEAKGSVGEWAAEWHIWLSAHGSHHQPWAHNLRRYWAKPPNHRPRWETATTYHLHLIHWALLPPQYGWIWAFFHSVEKALRSEPKSLTQRQVFGFMPRKSRRTTKFWASVYVLWKWLTRARARVYFQSTDKRLVKWQFLANTGH